MTFGATLQGQSSHDALIHRQDTEIKLLENFKKCLHSRIKADRDYAAALTSIVATAQKFDCSEYDSPLFKVLYIYNEKYWRFYFWSIFFSSYLSYRIIAKRSN